jgi:hypothetical protein
MGAFREAVQKQDQRSFPGLGNREIDTARCDDVSPNHSRNLSVPWKPMKVSQKCTLPSVSSIIRPVR